MGQDTSVVQSLEIVHISEIENALVLWHRHSGARGLSVVWPYLAEGPLWEVPLYNYQYLITGVHGRNSVIAAFVFSLLLLAWSVIDASIVAFVFIKSKVYDVEKSSEAKSSNDVSKEEMSSVAKSDDDVGREEMSSAARSDDSDDDQPHKSIEQPARFGLPQ